MKQTRIKRMCLTGVLTAVTFLFTAFLHIPSHTGYTHIGDAVIYLAACLLPLPYAVFTGVVGAVLADGLTGYALWAPASAVIKAAAVLFFSAKGDRFITKRNLFALLPASLLCIGGYYGYEVLLTGNPIAPLAGIPGYITQSVLSGVFFVAVGLTADKLKLKGRV